MEERKREEQVLGVQCIHAQEHRVHSSRTTGPRCQQFPFSSAAADVPAGRCKGTRYDIRDNEDCTKDTLEWSKAGKLPVSIGSRAGHTFFLRPRQAAFSHKYPSVSTRKPG